ncbi:MAG TPA: hypothetical protein VIN08_11570 [Ohtaekwangia sp.]|uniref:hypothetical protein n=1 Tax=Ohtaekwangia sp. TaxID=2066019 RepID=UPI002F921371
MNYSKPYYPLIAILLLCINACSDNDISDVISENAAAYLPLQTIGNYWEFVSLPEQPDYTVRKEVTGIKNLDNTEYYEVVTTHRNGSTIWQDTLYYHFYSNDYVATRTAKTTPEISFRLANQSEEWVIPSESDYDTHVTLTTLVNVSIGKRYVQYCKNFYYDVKEMADEENTIILAPDIGFVKEINSWGRGVILKEASVNGVLYTF